ncbi:MAG: HAD family hydrolase [Actinobacteria bacterium]|nr:HAD family hydrolase [Actinomycetota bacterium]
MTNKKGILFFDLDGTVADSGTGILASMNHVLEARHLQPLTREELTHVVGPPLSVSFPTFFAPRGVPADEMNLFIAEYRENYSATHLPRTPLNPGMSDALTELKNSWRLAIVTSKPEPQALIAIQATGVRHYFDIVVGPHDDSEIPKAQLLERALREMKELHGELPPLASCWMIGDRHHDIDAGVEVGTLTAGVLWGFGSREELSSAGATAIVETPQELVAVLNN